MTDQSYQFPRFFVTAPSPCPYLDGQEERKVFTDLTMAGSGPDSGPDSGPESGGEPGTGPIRAAAELHEALGRVGFRRSQSVAYRPACDNCAACVSVRVRTADFQPSRNMRRIIKANRDLIASPVDPIATEDQFEILAQYLETRHAEGGMADMDEFEYTEMVESSPVATTVVEYREPGKGDNLLRPGRLIAAALTDVLSDGLSMVYSFFDPESSRPSLGTYIILDHIERARRAGLPHVYLGYWVKGSQKMSYKSRFRPLERLTDKGWTEFDAAELGDDDQGA